MKKLLCLLLLCAILLPLSAFATVDVASLTDAQLTDLAGIIAAEQLHRAQATGEYLLSGTYGDATLGLKDIQTQQKGDKKILLLVFDFSHTADDAKMFFMSASIQVFQDGIELDATYSFDHPSENNNMKEIKKGATLEVVQAFELTSASPVEIELNELFSFDGRKPDAITVNVP